MILFEPRVAGWDNFYVIVGSSGAALIGLQFVVITLIAGLGRRTDPGALGAFGTPTVVHFTGALLVAAIMSAPWPTLRSLSVTLALCGFGGLAYGGIVARRAHAQTGYEPVLEDWLWFTILPSLAYLALGIAALVLRSARVGASFTIGAVALGLLLIGIHNAWDSVTHMVTQGPANREPAAAPPPPAAPPGPRPQP